MGPLKSCESQRRECLLRMIWFVLSRGLDWQVVKIGIRKDGVPGQQQREEQFRLGLAEAKVRQIREQNDAQSAKTDQAGKASEE